ncbi:MAG: RnfABCDGE type electron transport complex subunit D [Lachnospiraceae bacterium]|nr:RnfABCDGE type electron transport complex subunit D [Lachnospiraceae bacterium]MBR5356332.1 RnfABCDGE type electron transport complex subunit D [Lachnospiraceae bacterium]
MEKLLNVSSNPHIRSKVTTSSIMFCVIVALLPATGFGIFRFGINALLLVVVTTASACLFEFLFDLITKRKSTLGDFSAAVTGLLLALNLPPAAPWWIGVVGSFFAIVVVKMLFGGLGQNFMNPALGARCFLVISFASIMTNFSVDGVSSATPLQALKNGEVVDIVAMARGNIPGTIGEVSTVLILLGACILILCNVIDIIIPGTYIIVFSLCICLFGGHGFDTTFLAAHLAGGGLMLGAFFMATDYTTRPITKGGQFIYGIILGLLTAVFRIFGPNAEGVSFAIIIGNLLVPLIDKAVKPRFFGKGGVRI